FPRPKAHRAVYCDVGRFAWQMGWLKHAGYHVISLDEAWQGLFAGKPLPPRAVVLTFDDGYENFAEHAWPILRKHGFPATVFLVSSLIGAKADWLDDMGERPALMSKDTIRRLHAEGVTFGSHAVTHVRLSQQTPDEQRRQIAGSKAGLEDLLGAAVRHFCYPYGDYDTHCRDLVAEAGYRTGLTCIRGAANTANNAYEIPRKAISHGDNLLGFWWKLHMKHERKDHGGEPVYAS
ncbi:polysaccharide deacetylase family protein, partial [uncultured Pigmentiphaga sp.]|uniref:polysaccharide deacetylase family protein n=1 Tax=uncultured Pigmentiphaga sp. TaxID=340361 RepID=UPI00262E6237